MKCDRCGCVINTKKLMITITKENDKTVYCDKCGSEFLLLSELGMDAAVRTKKFLIDREILTQ